MPPDSAAAAVDVLLDVFPDFPGSNALDPGEQRRIARLLHERTIESGLEVGRVDAWGDPPVGVAVWLRRTALDEPQPPAAPRPSLRDVLPSEVIEPLARFDAVLQRLRAIARPDRHVYLDMLGVLPAHRRRGIATALLEAGHAWADGLGLPVALDTDTDENVAFYAQRGYVVIAKERLPNSGRDLVAMRRRSEAPTAKDPPASLSFRRARPAEAPFIRDLIVRSMGYWDHPPGYLEAARELMDLSGEDLVRDEAWVVHVDDAVAGFYRLSRTNAGAAEIEEFHLEPPMIGHGIGRRMFEHARDRARAMTVRELVWSTDANARGFYLRMGGEVTGTTASGVEGDEPLTSMRLIVTT